MTPVAQNSFAARVFLSFLATAGFFYVNIMAAMVSGLIDGLHFDKSMAGYIAAANVYGAAAGALLVVFVVTRWRWRPFATLLLAALIAIDVVSIFVRDAPVLLVLRFVHGCAGGALVGLSYSLFARQESPDKTFGVLLTVQYGLGGICIWLLPPLVPTYGTGVLFGALIAFSLVAFVMSRFLGEFPVVERAASVERGGRVGAALVLTLLTVFLFQASNMGIAAYLIEVAREAGLGTEEAGAALGFATWVGLLGGVIVVVLPARIGRLWPLIAGIVVSAVGTYALHGSSSLTVYLVANSVVSVAWSMCMAYLLGMCAQLKPDGRVAVIGGFVSKMGLATGPAVCAAALKSVGYPVLIDVSAAVMVVTAVLCFVPALRLDRR